MGVRPLWDKFKKRQIITKLPSKNIPRLQGFVFPAGVGKFALQGGCGHCPQKGSFSVLPNTQYQIYKCTGA